jgi:ribosomal protein S18 acetylase RimI-like enzyme
VAPPNVANLELRPAGPDDERFLFTLYASTRALELALLPWSDAEKEAFLRTQFDAQRRHYAARYQPAAHDLVFVEGEPVGRLYVVRDEDQILVVDIGLLPEHRGRGVGSALLTELIAEAGAAGKTVSVHVEHRNPARRLYERLGFVTVADQGMYVRLERRA